MSVDTLLCFLNMPKTPFICIKKLPKEVYKRSFVKPSSKNIIRKTESVSEIKNLYIQKIPVREKKVRKRKNAK